MSKEITGLTLAELKALEKKVNAELKARRSN